MEANNLIDLISLSDGQLLDAYSSTVTGVVKRTAHAVVHIRATRKIEDPRTRNKIDQTGSGSGFVISSDGYIVTTHHVIEDAHSVI